MANKKLLIDVWKLVIDLVKIKRCGEYDHEDVMAVIASQETVDAVEVAEYDAIVHKLECLLCHATGGKYSKAGYSWEDMERMVTDYIEECCQEAVDEEVVWCKNCKYYEYGHCRFWNTEIHQDNFCSFGESGAKQ